MSLQSSSAIDLADFLDSCQSIRRTSGAMEACQSKSRGCRGGSQVSCLAVGDCLDPLEAIHSPLSGDDLPQLQLRKVMRGGALRRCFGAGAAERLANSGAVGRWQGQAAVPANRETCTFSAAGDWETGHSLAALNGKRGRRRQSNRELGPLAHFALHLDAAVM